MPISIASIATPHTSRVGNTGDAAIGGKVKTRPGTCYDIHYLPRLPQINQPHTTATTTTTTTTTTAAAAAAAATATAGGGTGTGGGSGGCGGCGEDLVRI